MNSLLINSDTATNKLMLSLAKKLGTKVHIIKEEQYEDFVFGNMIENAKTGELVSREEVFKKLKL